VKRLLETTSFAIALMITTQLNELKVSITMFSFDIKLLLQTINGS
jgi:hypothetical protein